MKSATPLLVFLLPALLLFRVSAGVLEPEATVLLFPDEPALNASTGMGTPEVRGGKTRVGDIRTPHLLVYPAPAGKGPTPAVILVPGGGYQKLVPSVHWPIAEWFAQQGIRPFLLMYRTPSEKQDAGTLADIQQALRLVRRNAAEWNLDPDRIGLLGTSAGGHLSVRAAVAADAETRPAFSILLYPAYVQNRKTLAVGEWVKIPENMGPTLIIAARDDKHFPSSPAYAQTLQEAGAPVETLFFEQGGHGFSLRDAEATATWPEAAKAWLKTVGISNH